MRNVFERFNEAVGGHVLRADVLEVEDGHRVLLEELRGLGSGWQDVYCYEDSCYDYIERCA
jgi:hypothetical protein